MTAETMAAPQRDVSDTVDQKTPPKRWSRRIAADIVGVFDVAAVVAGAALPALIYGRVGGVVANWALLIQSGIAAAVIMHLTLRSMRLYDLTRMHDFPEKPGRLLFALVLSAGCTAGLGMPHAIKNQHMLVWFFTWLSTSYTLLLMNRGIANFVLRRLTAAGRFNQRIAVFAAGHIARRLHDHLTDPALGIKFAGVYDDRVGEGRLNPEGLTVAGRLDDLIAESRDGHIDQIIVALPQAADRRIAGVVKKLEQLPVSVHVVTHIASDLVDSDASHKVSSLGPIGLIDVKKKPLADWDPVLKWLEDHVVGFILLVAFLPLFPLIALAIKLESAGPVFFRQRRRGLNQRVIEVIKFRTMRVLEDGADVRQASVNDDRVTRVGRVLRRLSMDELPQLINVLRGDMSLVGPRPHALVHDEQFGEVLETYANRHQVKPGITGLAQVRGYRGETASASKIEARINADLDYIKNWSLGLDFKILAQTFWAVATGRNAH